MKEIFLWTIKILSWHLNRNNKEGESKEGTRKIFLCRFLLSIKHEQHKKTSRRVCGWVAGWCGCSISRVKETIKMPMEIWSFFKQLPSYPSSLKAVGRESDEHETLWMFIVRDEFDMALRAYHKVEWRSILSRKVYVWIFVWWPRHELKQIFSRKSTLNFARKLISFIKNSFCFPRCERKSTDQ